MNTFWVMLLPPDMHTGTHMVCLRSHRACIVPQTSSGCKHILGDVTAPRCAQQCRARLHAEASLRHSPLCTMPVLALLEMMLCEDNMRVIMVSAMAGKRQRPTTPTVSSGMAINSSSGTHRKGPEATGDACTVLTPVAGRACNGSSNCTALN